MKEPKKRNDGIVEVKGDEPIIDVYYVTCTGLVNNVDQIKEFADVEMKRKGGHVEDVHVWREVEDY